MKLDEIMAILPDINYEARSYAETAAKDHGHTDINVLHTLFVLGAQYAIQELIIKEKQNARTN